MATICPVASRAESELIVAQAQGGRAVRCQQVLDTRKALLND